MKAPTGICPECRRRYALAWNEHGGEATMNRGHYVMSGGWTLRKHNAKEGDRTMCPGFACDPLEGSVVNR